MRGTGGPPPSRRVKTVRERIKDIAQAGHDREKLMRQQSKGTSSPYNGKKIDPHSGLSAT